MGVTVTEITHFNGKTGAALAAGEHRAGADPYAVNGQYSAAYYHARYTVVTDALGADRVTVAGLSRLKANSRRLRLDVTAGAEDHTRSGGGGVTLDSAGAGALDVKLLPHATYYVWLFCDGWCDLFSDAAVQIGASGSFGTPGVPSAPESFFGSPVPITLTGGGAGALYTVTVSCAGRSETLQTQSPNTDLSWTPAVETFAPLLPNAPGAQATLSCETFCGGASVGTASACVTLRFAPGSLAPTLSPGWAAAAPYNAGGAAAGLSVYVQGHSRAALSFDTAKIACAYGASPASFRVECAGETLTAAPYRTGVLGGTSVPVRCTVTDSRGQSASETLRLAVEPYAKPALAAPEVFRCDANGTADEDGSCLAVRASALVSPLAGQNPYTLAVRTRPVPGSYGSAAALTSGVTAVLGGASPDRTCDVRVELTDALGESAVWEQRLPTRAWAMKLRPDGRGVGFGKAPEYGEAIEVPASWTLRFGGKSLHPDMLGPAESGALAAANHAAGELLLWDGALVRCDTALAAGDALAGRVAATSVAQELAALETALTAQAGTLSAQGGTLTAQAGTLAALSAALGRIVRRTLVLDEQSVTHGSYAVFTLDASHPGHTPLGLLGWAIENASTGGGLCSWCSVYRAVLVGTNAEISVRNHHSSSNAKIRLCVDVLYI